MIPAISKIFLALLIVVAFIFLSDPQSTAATGSYAENSQPNILLIVADDLGYSDLGSFGGEIHTPNLDDLASLGVRFSNFHVLPTCSPSRTALLSGNDNHVAGMGVMGEFVYPAIANQPGYEGYLNDRVATIPELLRETGYHTYMAGKWHLGKVDSQSPFRRGFEQTFTMMNGGGSHWADMRPLSPTEDMIYRRNGKKIAALPKDFYSTKNYTDELISFIESNSEDEKPFFAYLSYTAPHDPLHAPAEYISRYKGQYDKGWNELAVRRLSALQKLGLVPEQVHEMPPNFMTQKWAELSSKDQQIYARDMEVYAAMIDYMDMSIGRLLNFLKSKGLYDNTLIVFFSDNGANGAHATAYPGNADGKYLSSFDNRLENRGLKNSFIDMGPSWAQASTAPFRLFKSFTTQGGIKSPLIIKMPSGIEITDQWNHSFWHVTDIMPTFLQIAGVTYPTQLQSKELKQPIGRSMLPALIDPSKVPAEQYGMGYELFEMKAFIEGEWKILRLPKPFGTGDWQLYNIGQDPGEIDDVSASYPEIKTNLVNEWQEYSERNGVVDHKGLFDELYRKAYGTAMDGQ